MLHDALIYLAAIFALGFVLGTIRTLWLAPAVGHLAAVALELAHEHARVRNCASGRFPVLAAVLFAIGGVAGDLERWFHF